MMARTHQMIERICQLPCLHQLQDRYPAVAGSESQARTRMTGLAKYAEAANAEATMADLTLYDERADRVGDGEVIPLRTPRRPMPPQLSHYA